MLNLMVRLRGRRDIEFGLMMLHFLAVHIAVALRLHIE